MKSSLSIKPSFDIGYKIINALSTPKHYFQCKRYLNEMNECLTILVLLKGQGIRIIFISIRG